jgi:hypothetical protein
MNQQIVGVVAGLEQRSGGWVAVSILEPGKEYPKKLSTKKQDLIGQAQQLMGQLVTAGFNEQDSTNINPHNGQPYTNRYLEALAYGQVDLVGMPTQIQPQQFMPQPQAQPQQQFQGQPQGFTGAPAAQPFVPPVPPAIPVAQPQPTMQQAPQAHPTGTIQHVVTTDAIREGKIHRQTATKVAAAMLPLLAPENHNLASLIRISEQLVKYYDEGVPWQTNPISPGEAHDAQAQQQYQQAQQAQPQQGYENPAEQGQPYYGEPDPDDDIPF